MTTKNKIILAASAAALLFLTGMISGCLIHRSYVRAHQLPVQRDTVTKWRTATTESPAPTESHKGTDPVSIPVSELTPSQDSSAVLVQQDIRTYDDTLSNGASYHIQISGIQPNLDAVQFTYPERTITNTITNTRPYEGWILSASGSTAITGFQPFKGSAVFGPEISYNKGIFHFAIQTGAYMEYGKDIKTSFSPYGGARLTLDIVRFNK